MMGFPGGFCHEFINGIPFSIVCHDSQFAGFIHNIVPNQAVTAHGN